MSKRSRFILRVDQATFAAMRERLLKLEIEHGADNAPIALMRDFGVRLPLSPWAMEIELVVQKERPDFLILEPADDAAAEPSYLSSKSGESL